MSHNSQLAARLFGSSLIAQIAVLVATAVAARSTTPADFAAYGVVASICAVLSTFNTWAAETRLPVVDSVHAHSLSRAGSAANTLVLATCVTAAALVWLCSSAHVALLLLVGGFVGYFTGWQQMLTGMALREQQQELLARGRVVQGLSNAILMVLFLALGLPGFVVITVAWALSVFCGDIGIAVGLRWKTAFRDIARRDDWSYLFRELRAFPVSQVLVSVVGAAPLIILPAAGATSLAGSWALANRFLSPVVTTLNNTVQPIYYGHAAQLMRQNQASNLRTYHSMWVRRLMFGAFALAACFAVGLWFVFPMLGDHWMVVRSVALSGVIYFATLFAFLPLSQTLLLTGHVSLQTRWSIGRLVVCMVPLALIPIIGAWLALTAWAIASAATFVTHVLLERHVIAEGTHHSRPRATPRSALAE